MIIYDGILTLEKLGTALNYLGIFITLAKIPRYFNPGKGGTMVNYFGIFIALAPPLTAKRQ